MRMIKKRAEEENKGFRKEDGEKGERRKEKKCDNKRVRSNKEEKEGGDGRGYAIDRDKNRCRDMEDRGG